MNVCRSCCIFHRFQCYCRGDGTKIHSSSLLKFLQSVTFSSAILFFNYIIGFHHVLPTSKYIWDSSLFLLQSTRRRMTVFVAIFSFFTSYILGYVLFCWTFQLLWTEVVLKALMIDDSRLPFPICCL